MWMMFTVAALLLALGLYLPGYLILRSVRLAPLFAFACAPLAVLLIQNVLCTCLGMWGVPSTWMLAFGVPLALGVVCWAASHVRAGGRSGFGMMFSCKDEPLLARGPSWLTIDRAGVAAFLMCGIVLGLGLFVTRLFSPDAFIESVDTVHHLGSIRAFAESGNWSSFGATLYMGADADLDPFIEGAYYPSAWHALGAALVNALGVSPMLAANAVNAVFVSVVFPCALYAAMRVAFGKHARAALFAAPFPLACASFPWKMFTWGPLYPNIMAYCLLPLYVLAVIALIGPRMARRERVMGFSLFAAGVLVAVFVQPNVLFAAGALLIPYCVQRAFCACRSLVPGNRGFAMGFAAGVLVAAAVAAAWYAAFSLPFLQSIVQYYWPPEQDVPRAIGDALSLRYRVGGTQIALGLLAFVGIVAALRTKGLAWLAWSYLLATALYVAAAAGDGFWHQLLAGFWYTDAPRIAAFAAMAAVPLEGLGIYACARGSARIMKDKGRAVSKEAVGAAMLAVACVAVFAPYGLEITPDSDGRAQERNGLYLQAGEIERQYGYYTGLELDSFEKEFLERVMQTVEPGAVILNEPSDGSAYAYGVHGMRTYYRYWRGYGGDDEKPESVLLRMELARISSDTDVRAAVDELGIRYVLVLDQGDWEWWQKIWFHRPEDWKGIDAIVDGTPGFTVVLSEGDMRLYRID